MTDSNPASAPLPGAQPDRMFPELTAEQVARVALHGQALRVETGEVLAEAGEEYAHFFVVKTGQIDVVRVSGEAQEVIANCRVGQLCRGDKIIVVGGGNSAGQAAVFLARTVKRVHVLIRSSGLV